MGTTTSNYGFFMPDDADSMADVKKNVTDNFKKIESRNDITVVASEGALPQSGTYNIGDRVFRNDPVTSTTWPSNYLLICKDTNWGWHWRPIQHIISPWVNVPATALNDANFEIHPTYPLQIALDSRGFCHWRGAIRRTTAGIPAATSFTVFKSIPLGIRPNVRFMHTTPISPIQSGTGTAGYVGGRVYMQEDGTSSIRCYNTANGVSQSIWFTGLKYNNSDHWYFNG
jgi:hypothetical protein